MASSTKYGEVTVERETGNPLNGTDEPVFVIRARDAASIPTLIAYGKLAREIGAGYEHTAAVTSEVARFSEWLSGRGDLLKVPD